MKSACIAIFLVLSGALGAQTAAPTVTGSFLPGMDQVDGTVLGLMAKYGCPGAALAITYQGRLVLARGYGLADVASGTVVQPDSLMRVGSLSKFVTAIAVMTLVQQGRIDLDAPAFALIPQLTPLPGATVDPRLKTITVRQLLQHTGGWDALVSGDPLFESDAISAAAGTPPPASADTIIRYMLGQPLDFDPGTQFAYSNFGYCVLGRIIETVTGQTYGDYVQGAVFAPAGVTRAVLGRSLAADRAPGEVTYYDYPGAPLVNSVFPPTTALVPMPYGGFYLEAADSAGGWVMNTIDYVRLWAAIDGSRAPALLSAPSVASLIARPAPPVSVNATDYYAMGLEVQTVNDGTLTGAIFLHAGSLSGTSTYEIHLFTGWTIALFFNTQPLAVTSFQSDVVDGIEAEIVGLTPPATGDLFLTAKPEIIAAPVAQYASLGGMVTFAATVSSVTAPTYQWFKDGVAIPGASGPTYQISSVTAADFGSYSVTVTNAAGTTQSGSATLALGDLPSITSQPAAQTIATGSTVVFNISAGGAPTLTYQWFLNATPLAGATGPILVLPNATAADDGSYTCVIANPFGSVTSLPATLSVSATSSPGRLVNLSCRAQVGTGGNILIAGFAVGGQGPPGSEPLLIRGSGPALVGFGVPGTLPDPQLQLFMGSTVLATNDGWGGSAAIEGAAASVGAFAWSVPSSHDSALLESLPRGPYTAQIAGQAGDSGVALAEVYDATPSGAYAATSPRLVNISARVQVGSGAGTLIAGFVIGGATAKTVLIRASGPALAPFGVSGTLPDPRLELFSGTTQLAGNSGWGGNAEIGGAASAVGAFAWSNPSSKDSAILVTLSPGPYTVQVSGASGDTGVALVELYEVP
jgi:CubicO group peptidase (beta-lactamase class C family)